MWASIDLVSAMEHSWYTGQIGHPNAARISVSLLPGKVLLAMLFKAVALSMLLAALLGLPASASDPSVAVETFDAERAWDGFRNRLVPPRPGLVHQDFGHRSTNYAGGQRPGEIGGFVQRSSTAAWYAEHLPNS